MSDSIRLLAIIEAATITGPAKNLLQFASLARTGDFRPRVEVSIAVFQRDGQPELFLETARKATLPVFPILEKGRFDRAVIGELTVLARHLQPDLIQSHAVKSHFLVRQSGLHRLAPWIAFHHGYTSTDLRTRVYNQLDRWSLPSASQVLTVSCPFRDELVAKGVPSGRIEIIHNATDRNWGRSARKTETALALRARWKIPADRKVVLIVGRLSHEKDHLTLLRAINALRDLNPHLIVVGEGPERASIESLVRELGLEKAVTLTGQCPSAEPYYGIADLAVLSSRSEGSPNALLEAMAAGVPVVATAVGGIPEIVRHRESALLVQPGDIASIAAAMRELLTHPDLAELLTERAYELILTRHTPESRVRRLIDIYARVRSSQEA